MSVLDTYIQGTRWFAVRNISGEDIPPYAPMRVGKLKSNGEPTYPQELTPDGELVILVSKPDEESHEAQDLSIHCFNGPHTIFRNQYGQATIDFPAKVRHHPRDETYTGDVSGFVRNQWYLSNRAGGDSLKSWDHAIGTPTNSTQDCIWVVPNYTPSGPVVRQRINGSAGFGLSSTLPVTLMAYTVFRPGRYRLSAYGTFAATQTGATQYHPTIGLAAYVNGSAALSSRTISGAIGTARVHPSIDDDDIAEDVNVSGGSPNPTVTVEVTIERIRSQENMALYDLIDLEEDDEFELRLTGSATQAGQAIVFSSVGILEWHSVRFDRQEFLRNFAASHPG